MQNSFVFSGQWLFGPIVCDFFVTSDVLMCTSSILHLCTISLERYMAIRFPLAIRNKSKTVVALKVVSVWVIALAITSPITILGLMDEKNVLNNSVCALSNQHFIIYGSICAFFIPLTIMVISYSFTLYLLIGQSNCQAGRGKQEDQPMMRRSLSRKAKRRTHVKFSAQRTHSCPLGPEHEEDNHVPIVSHKSRIKTSISFPLHKNKRNNNQVPPPSSQSSQTPSPVCPRQHAISESSNIKNSHIDNHCEQCNSVPKSEKVKTGLWTSSKHTEKTQSSSLQGLVKKHQLVIKAASILLMRKEDTPLKKIDDVHTEQKASKVIGIVFILFVVCWAPFFIVNILTVLCDSCFFNSTLVTAFVWLGYVSSTLNPIVYTMFNKTFKQTFKKLIFCRYNTLQRKKRVRSWLLGNGNSFQAQFSSTNSLDTPC